MAESNDLGKEYLASREDRMLASGADSMIEWVMRNRGGVVTRPVRGAGAPEETPLEPFPTDQKPPAEQSTAGRVMRNVGEIPGQAIAGVESAISNAMGFAIDPLANWLNEHVADLSYTRDKPQTGTGAVTKSVSEFLTGFVPALKGLRAVGMAGKVAAPLAASGIADFATKEPHEARLSNLWQEAGLPENVLTDYLAADPKDGAIEGRFKSAAESVFTGAALEGIVLGARALRAARSVGKADQAELAALKERYGELTDETFRKTIGDPSKPMVELVVKQPSAASGKIKAGMQATSGEPPVPKGMVRLYRGQLGEFPPSTDAADAGRFFSTDKGAADFYGDVRYVDVPEDVAKAAHEQFLLDPAGVQKKSGRLLPAEWANKAKPLPKGMTPDDLIGGRGVVDAGEMKLAINFGRMSSPDDVKAVIADMAEKFTGTIDEARRGVITQKETSKLADDLGMSVPDLLERTKGQAFNAEQIVAARKLWASSGEKLLESARAAADPNAGPLDQYAFRKMLATHHAIQAEVLGMRAEAGRALAAWKIPAGGAMEKARSIDQMVSAMGGPGQSQELARRLAILAEHGDKGALAKFAEKASTASSMDVVREVWINGLLSSPATHAVNTLSNTAVAFQAIVERGVGSQIAQLRGATDSVAPGEAMAMAYGLVTATKDAFRLAAKSFKTGETGFALNKVDLPMRKALAAETFGISSETGLGRMVDFVGEAARIPGRFLGAEDEFFKTIGYRMNLHAHALRQATQEGLTGPALGKRMREIVLDPPEHIRIQAADAALYQTFTNAPGAIGQAFMGLREKVPAISFILPFVRTPVNIARYTFERTPFAPLVSQWRDDIAAGGARADLALARMATGTSVMLMALDYADSGLISGAGPKDAGEREAMIRQGWQPYSIKVGDRWHSYNRTDPFGAMLGFSADTAGAIRGGELNEDDVDEWQEALAMSITAVSQVAVNKTYLRGVSDFIEVMSDPKRYGEGYVNNLIASFVPFTALSGAIERGVDPTVRDATTPWQAIQAKVAGLSEKLPARRNLWGEEIRAESGLGKAYDFFSPVQSREIKPSPIDMEIMRLAPVAGRDNVEGAAPARIGKRTTFDGVAINFKEWPEVYDAYVRLAGNDLKHPAWRLGAKDYLDAVVSGNHTMSRVYSGTETVKWPDEHKLKFIKATISDFRKLAQQAILNDPQFADFAQYVRSIQSDKQQSRMPILQ
jgi:hypothetical protein